MKIWIIQYHHRHGVDVWPVANEDRPDLEEIENGLDDFEPEREEFLEATGPFDLPDDPTRSPWFDHYKELYVAECNRRFLD